MTRTILTVDDSPSMRALLRHALAAEGYTVAAAEDGVDALERIDDAAPDLVITDINMPRMDGFGLIEAVRATPLPNVPPHIRGVVNLRGVVLPVLDLRMRLGWGLTDPTTRHVIIVVKIGQQLQGMIVDAVNDIVTVNAQDMQPLPDIGSTEAAALLEGLATVDDRMILVLDLDRLAPPLADAA